MFPSFCFFKLPCNCSTSLWSCVPSGFLGFSQSFSFSGNSSFCMILWSFCFPGKKCRKNSSAGWRKSFTYHRNILFDKSQSGRKRRKGKPLSNGIKLCIKDKVIGVDALCNLNTLKYISKCNYHIGNMSCFPVIMGKIFNQTKITHIRHNNPNITNMTNLIDLYNLH